MSNATAVVRDGDIAGARRLIAEGAVVIDVRTPEEAALGMIPGAKLMPSGEFARFVNDVEALVGGDKSRPVVMYCKAGGRVIGCKGLLQRAGFTYVVNAGGYDGLR